MKNFVFDLQRFVEIPFEHQQNEDGTYTLIEANNGAFCTISGITGADDLDVTFEPPNHYSVNIWGSIANANTADVNVTITSLNGRAAHLSIYYYLEAAKSSTYDTWKLDESTNTASYGNRTTTGYYVDGNSIKYRTEEGRAKTDDGADNIYFTVAGVTSKDGLTVNTENKIVKVAASSLGTSDVSISGGDTLIQLGGMSSTENSYVAKGIVNISSDDISSNGAKVTSNAQNYPFIIRGKTGGKDKDVIYGGSKNDILEGGAGKDIIYGFENDDMLKITGKFSATYDSGTQELYFNVGSKYNAITVKNFTATSFNINGDTYQINYSNFEKK